MSVWLIQCLSLIPITTGTVHVHVCLPVVRLWVTSCLCVSGRAGPLDEGSSAAMLENIKKSETFLQKTPLPWKHFWLKRFKSHSVPVRSEPGASSLLCAHTCVCPCVRVRVCVCACVCACDRFDPSHRLQDCAVTTTGKLMIMAECGRSIESSGVEKSYPLYPYTVILLSPPLLSSRGGKELRKCNKHKNTAF